MTRHREFEETEVLERAMLVFWKHGYEGCSIQELVAATGVQRQSLYNLFGDKEGLFLRVLGYYEAQSEKALESLNREDATLLHLRRYMENVLKLQEKLEVGGCLLVKTAFGPDFEDPRIRQVIERAAVSVRVSMAGLLDRAIELGKLPADTDSQRCAAFLHTVLNGLIAIQRTGGTADEVQATLSFAMAAITKENVAG